MLIGFHSSGWLPEYTTELLHVLGLLVEMEPVQAELLEAVCSGAMVTEEELTAAGALMAQPSLARKGVRKKVAGETLGFD